MSHIVPKFLGHVQEGRVKVLDTKRYLEHLKKLESKDVEITVQKVRSLRSQQQMRYYWGVVIQIISDDTGNDPEQIHEYLKLRFAPPQFIKLKGKARQIPGCTHDLFRDNFFDDYIRKIQAWYALDFGGVIPDPNEAQL
jgi:hypothetical protein